MRVASDLLSMGSMRNLVLVGLIGCGITPSAIIDDPAAIDDKADGPRRRSERELVVAVQRITVDGVQSGDQEIILEDASQAAQETLIAMLEERDYMVNTIYQIDSA